MREMRPRIHVRNLLTLTGSYCAFYMGASFSCGQESMQFFSTFGTWGYLGLLVVLLLYILFNSLVIRTSYEQRFREPYAIFPYYCGPRAGQFFVIAMTVILCCTMIMVAAGAGANLEENFGLPNYAGRCVIWLSALSVCLGLKRIVDILGLLGPFVACVMLLIAVVSILRAPTHLNEVNGIIDGLDVYRGGSNFFFAAIRYCMFCSVASIPILVVSGIKSEGRRESRLAAPVQVTALGLIFLLMLTAQLLNIQELYSWEIPNLRLVALYVSWLTPFFSLILLVCTYSTLTVLLWSIVRKFAEEKTRRYYVLTLSIAAATMVGSGTMPFSVILNKMTLISTALGAVFMCFILKFYLSKRIKGRSS